MKRALFFFLVLFSLSFAQFYQLYIVRASDHSTTSLLYDDNSTSYKENSLENPDAELRVCALNAADLQGKWVSLVYADGINPGDYIEITHFPVQITNVPPNLCAYVHLEISSFKAWYPSIPFLFISDTPDLSGAERIKFLPSRGWLIGNYTVASTQVGNQVTVDVTDALDDGGASIIPDVDFLVVGLLENGTLITTDTEITSPNNPVNLSLGAYTGAYNIHINGIGPGQFGPNVTILTPQPITYDTRTIPFTYEIISYYDVVSCWYILDSTRVDMPDCTIPYILNVNDGTHTLTLYANDTEGQVGSDSVRFTVTTEVPPTPYQPGGPGGPHIPQPPPVVPPIIPPAYDVFTLTPEDIWITIDYPWEGQAGFSLESKNRLVDVACFVKGDFAKYSKVELESTEIPDGGAISGTITVGIPPEILIDYKGSTEGVLQCVGKSTVNSTLLLSTSANIYLKINEPLVTVENITVELYPGQIILANITINNTGEGNASTYMMAVQFGGKEAKLINVTQTPEMIGHWETGNLLIMVAAPIDFPAGEYRVPLTIYSSGAPIGSGYSTIRIKEGAYLPLAICTFPLFVPFYAFYDSLPMWIFLIILALANYSLLRWRKRHRWHRRLLVSIAPLLLSLPGVWIFTPCFMMNVSLAQFILTFLWKLFREKETEELYEGRKQKRKPARSEEKAEEEKDRKMAKEEEK